MYASHPDPILTPIGRQQAQETGSFMMQEIERIQQAEGRNFDEIRVIASPFERTITTCAEVARGIGQTNIHLDYAWVEAMYTQFYSENPLPHLESR